MVRVTNGLTRHKRHRKYMLLAKWFRLWRKNVYKQVRLALVKQQQHAYRNRKEKKREFRRLWISRISAALCESNISYSRFIDMMTKSNVIINRKVLSNIAIAFPEVFTKIVEEINTAKK